MEVADKTVQKDHNLVSGSEADVSAADMKKLCDSIEPKIAKNCWGELGYRYASMTVSSANQASELMKLCEKSRHRDSTFQCYMNGATAIAISTNNQKVRNGLCEPLQNDQELFSQCLSRLPNSMLQSSIMFADQALDFCSQIASSVQPDCFHSLVRSAKLYGTAENYTMLCQKIPKVFADVCQ